MAKNAVIILSGGLDSSTCLAIAKSQGFDCYALTFSYGQRSVSEIKAAQAICKALGVIEHRVMPIDIGQFRGSALTDTHIDIPHQISDDIPVTYVPARNTVFLSIALAWAEVLQAWDIFFGANKIDYQCYPDCRPEYIQAFEKMANLATKAGAQGQQFKVRTPLIEMTKAEIIKTGLTLDVDYSLTNSCYDADEQGRACGQCQSCLLRAEGFEVAGVADPTHYR